MGKTKTFSKTLYKIPFTNKRNTQTLLGIDILKESVKDELLTITALSVERAYTKIMRHSNPTLFIQKQSQALFLECMHEICESFLTKKFGFKVKVSKINFKTSLYTKNLLKDADILFKVTLLAFLNPRSTGFRSVYYPVYNQASESFLEALIDNVVLEISNCIVYFTIINFSSVYAFRQVLYKSKFLSLRNLERFKNNFSWQIYIKNYIQRPADLYNNRYRLSIIKTTGVYGRVIYANRSKEIASLSNLPLLTIIFIETKDFILSRFDEAIFITSKSLRFTLTSVIGKVIGLIWRGIIEGLKK